MRKNQNREVKKWVGVSKREKREELNWTSLMFSVLPKLEKPVGWFFKLNLASTNCSLYSAVRAAREKEREQGSAGRGAETHKHCFKKIPVQLGSVTISVPHSRTES